MKKFMIPLLMAFTLLSSCSTLDTGKSTSIINIILPSATRIMLTKKPKYKGYVMMVKATIDVFAMGDELDPIKLEKALNSMDSFAPKDPDVKILIMTILNFYKEFYAESVSKQLDNKNIKSFLISISNALEQGLIGDEKNPINVIK